MSPMTTAAADLVAVGLAVFPVRPNRKEPALRNWQTLAASNPADAEALFRRYPDCNVGVVTGERSGVFVLDVDRKGVDGLTTLIDLENQFGSLPPTWRAETASGGLHCVPACKRDPLAG